MTGPAAAVVDGPPLVGAELAAAVVGAAVVPAAAAADVAAVPPLLSPPHAAATNPNDTSTVVGPSHRCFATKSPDVRRHANAGRSAAPGMANPRKRLGPKRAGQLPSQPEQCSESPFRRRYIPNSGVEAGR